MRPLHRIGAALEVVVRNQLEGTLAPRSRTILFHSNNMLVDRVGFYPPLYPPNEVDAGDLSGRGRPRSLALGATEIQASGVETLTGIARTLQARGVKTPRGRIEWQPVQVSRLLAA